MIEKVDAYKSADGALFETELEAAKASMEYWKREVERLSKPTPRPIPQPGDPDHHYSYEGGHQ